MVCFEVDNFIIFDKIIFGCSNAILLSIFSVKTLTTDDDYSRSNRENLPLPIQRQLSEKLKTFSELFIAVLKSTLKLEHFEKK